MNCVQAKKIPIRKVLESFSFFPSKERAKTAFYFSLDHKEKTPSLLVDYVMNSAFDFGTGKKFDNISIVQAVKRCSVSEALEYLKQFDFPVPKQNIQLRQIDTEKHYKILEVSELNHPALLDYLRSRKIEFQKSEVQEIHYELNGKRYFGIGFQNDSGGYEIRNKYCKICLGKKDLTTIKNQSNTLRIFEGFADFLSFKILENSLEKSPSDYLVLNSVSMVHKAIGVINNYQFIELYLDNDNTGDLATEKLNSRHSSAEDSRLLYRGYKDLNDFILGNPSPCKTVNCNSP